jgi:hypothetical protein
VSYKEQFIWKKAVGLSVRCYKLTEYFPKSEIYGMTSQIKRIIISLKVELTKSNYIQSVLKDSDEIQRLLVITINKLSS